MQEQTANLHKQFLDNQQAALATLQTLVAQQQALLTGQAGPAGAVAADPGAATAGRAPVPPVPVAPSPRCSAARAPRPAPVAARGGCPPALPARSHRRPDASGILLAVVAEKTGYPADMLELDMDLDADLGIDSIKRVEILSALQETAPRRPGRQARAPGHAPHPPGHRRLPCDSGHVPPSEGNATRRTEPPRQRWPGPRRPTADVAGMLLAVVAEKTGYPADMLELDMELDADLGIDSIKRVEILSALQERIPDAPAVKPEHLGTLHTLRDIATFLGHAAADRRPADHATAGDPPPFRPGAHSRLR